MNLKDTLSTFLILLSIMVGTVFLTHWLWKDPAQQPAAIPDTVWVKHVVSDSAKSKPVLIPVKEKVNIDSLWQEALAYWINLLKTENPEATKEDLNSHTYAMQSDSTFADSSKGLSEKLSFISPIPLHPKSYFKREATWYSPVITQTVQQPKDFWDRFGWSINASAGYGIIHKQFDFYVGAGGSFRIGKK